MGWLGKILGGAAGYAIGGPLGLLIGGGLGHAADVALAPRKGYCPHCQDWVAPREGTRRCPACKEELADAAPAPAGRGATRTPEASAAGLADAAGAAGEHATTDARSAAVLGGADGVALTPEEERQFLFFVSTFALLSKLADADGAISRSEEDVVDEFLAGSTDLAPEARAFARRVFRVGRDSANTFAEYARQFAGLFADAPAIRWLMIDLLCAVARADGVLHPREGEHIAEAAAIFGLPADAVELILAAQASGDPSHAELGLPPDVAPETLAAWVERRLADTDPRRLAAQGLPEEFRHLAARRQAEIRAAHAALGRPGSEG